MVREQSGTVQVSMAVHSIYSGDDWDLESSGEGEGLDVVHKVCPGDSCVTPVRVATTSTGWVKTREE